MQKNKFFLLYINTGDEVTEFKAQRLIFWDGIAILLTVFMDRTDKIDIWIIIGFAVLHAVVALLCRLVGLTDELILTLLTMLLIIILCLRRDMKVEFMAISIILVNVLGFLFGTLFAWLFDFVSDSPGKTWTAAG